MCCPIPQGVGADRRYVSTVQDVTWAGDSHAHGYVTACETGLGVVYRGFSATIKKGDGAAVHS